MSAEKNNNYALGNDGGAPTKFKPEYTEQVYKLCLLGFTDKQLAVFFEVSEDTIYQWKKDHQEFSEAVKAGKTMADAEVVKAMYKRAIGFSYDEVTFEKIDSKVNLEVSANELITTDAYKKKIVTKLVVPDTGAQMNWLKNRQRELWRDKQDLGFDFDTMPEEMLDMIIAKLTEKAKSAS